MNANLTAGANHHQFIYYGWQFVSQGDSPAEHLFYIHLALDAGCKWVQLRLKDCDETEIIRTGVAVSRLCAGYSARFILNDYAHLASQVRAQGVHLGLNDCPVREARKLLNKDCIIGATANTIADVEARLSEKVDYIGLGPYRYTTTKKNLSPVLGLEGYRQILLPGCNAKQKKIPVFAIGGVTVRDLPELLNAGVDGVAVSGWVTGMVDLKAWAELSETDLTVENAEAQYLMWKKYNASAAFKVLARIASLNDCPVSVDLPGN